MTRLRIVVAPSLWRLLASGCAALGLLIAGTALIDLAQIEYVLLFSARRVQLQLFGERADMALWAAAMILLTLVLLASRRHDRPTLTLGMLASIAPVLLILAPSFLHDGLVVIGTLLTVITVWRVAKLNKEYLGATWACLAGLLIIIELAALAHWLIFPFSTMLAVSAAQFELNLAYLGYALVSSLVVVLALSWIPFFLPRIEGATVGKLREIIADTQRSLRSSRIAKLGLGFVTVGLAALVGSYPYLSLTSRLVGVDIDCCYMPLLSGVLANGLNALQGSDRIFFLGVLYAIHLTTGASAFTILMILPALLTILTAVATYVFIWLSLRDFWVAISAAMVSTLTFNTTVVIFMDLFANWFANVLLLFTLSLLLYAFSGVRHRKLASCLGVAMSVLVLFSHALVWWSMIAIVALFGVLSLLLTKTGRARRLAILTAFAAANLVAYGVRLTSGTAGSVLDANIIAADYSGLAWGLVNGSVYGPFWLNLGYFIRQTAVFYGSWLILALAIAGSLLLGLRAVRSDSEFRWMLGSWMFVAAILTVTLSNLLNPYYSPTTYMPLVWRGLFMMPVQVTAGIAVASLLGSRSGRFGYVLVMLALLDCTFRSLALAIFL